MSLPFVLNIILILVMTVCFTIVGAIYGYKVKAPTYSATATAVVMLDRSDSSTQGPNTSDFVYATYYTSTFSTFIQSNPVINNPFSNEEINSSLDLFPFSI